jgi:hypothetical protein
MAGFDYKDELMAGIYREERMHEAEVVRIIRQAEAQKQKHSNLLVIALNWFGRQLINLGTHLQKNEMSRHTS